MFIHLLVTFPFTFVVVIAAIAFIVFVILTITTYSSRDRAKFIFVFLLSAAIFVGSITYAFSADNKNKVALETAAKQTYGITLTGEEAGKLLGVASDAYSGFGSSSPAYASTSVSIVLSRTFFTENGVRKIRTVTQRVHLVHEPSNGRWAIVAVAPQKIDVSDNDELPKSKKDTLSHELPKR